MTKLTNPNQDQRHKYHHLTTTLKMTTAQIVKTSVTNDSLSKDYPHPDDHAKEGLNIFGSKRVMYMYRPLSQYSCSAKVQSNT